MGSTAREVSLASVSTRAKRPGCSVLAERIRPQSAAAAGFGDSLSSIARRFRVTVDKLVEWNKGAAEKYLQPGQRLKMVVDVTEQSS